MSCLLYFKHKKCFNPMENPSRCYWQFSFWNQPAQRYPPSVSLPTPVFIQPTSTRLITYQLGAFLCWPGKGD